MYLWDVSKKLFLKFLNNFINFYNWIKYNLYSSGLNYKGYQTFFTRSIFQNIKTKILLNIGYLIWAYAESAINIEYQFYLSLILNITILYIIWYIIYINNLENDKIIEIKEQETLSNPFYISCDNISI